MKSLIVFFFAFVVTTQIHAGDEIFLLTPKTRENFQNVLHAIKQKENGNKLTITSKSILEKLFLNEKLEELSSNDALIDLKEFTSFQNRPFDYFWIEKFISLAKQKLSLKKRPNLHLIDFLVPRYSLPYIGLSISEIRLAMLLGKIYSSFKTIKYSPWHSDERFRKLFFKLLIQTPSAHPILSENLNAHFKLGPQTISFVGWDKKLEIKITSSANNNVIDYGKLLEMLNFMNSFDLTIFPQTNVIFDQSLGGTEEMNFKIPLLFDEEFSFIFFSLFVNQITHVEYQRAESSYSQEWTSEVRERKMQALAIISGLLPHLQELSLGKLNIDYEVIKLLNLPLKRP